MWAFEGVGSAGCLATRSAGDGSPTRAARAGLTKSEVRLPRGGRVRGRPRGSLFFLSGRLSSLSDRPAGRPASRVRWGVRSIELLERGEWGAWDGLARQGVLWNTSE
jgi:hypothetical protein